MEINFTQPISSGNFKTTEKEVPFSQDAVLAKYDPNLINLWRLNFFKTVLRRIYTNTCVSYGIP